MQANYKIAKFLDVLSILNDEGKRIPGIIMAMPGFGKTTTIEMFCEVKNYNLTTLIASQYTADDLLGFQIRIEGSSRLTRALPEWYTELIEKAKNGRKNILFIDELSSSEDYIQPPLLRLIFEGMFGEYSLPENTMVVAAGNYQDDLESSFKMLPPLINRFMILNINEEDVDVQELCTDKFDRVKRSDLETKAKFLGIFSKKKSTYNYDNIVAYLSSFLKVTNNYEIKNSKKSGLTGITTPRSISYSLQFLKAYLNTYSDDLWIPVISDTLGNYEGYDLKKGLISMRGKFVSSSGNNLSVEVMDIARKVATGELPVTALKEYAKRTNELTVDDKYQLDRLAKKYPTNRELGSAINVLSCAWVTWEDVFGKSDT